MTHAGSPVSFFLRRMVPPRELQAVICVGIDGPVVGKAGVDDACFPAPDATSAATVATATGRRGLGYKGKSFCRKGLGTFATAPETTRFPPI